MVSSMIAGRTPNSTGSESPEAQKKGTPPAPGSSSTTHTSEVPRPKRIACILCRKRKLKCDGLRPSCATCSRLGHDCAYDEVRRKSGPKRGYVKALEARLAQVETLLKDQAVGHELIHTPHDMLPSAEPTSSLHTRLLPDQVMPTPQGTSFHAAFHNSAPSQSPHSQSSGSFGAPSGWTDTNNIDPVLSWDMMSLGMEEPLPSQEIMDALHNIFFEKVYPSLPILHKPRYLASLDNSPYLRPPLALRYAIWTLAAAASDEYTDLQTHFYQLSRKYLQDAEMKGHGEGILSICITQAWALISCYEFRRMYFPRAWLSTGRAVRSAQSMGLHRLDGKGMDVKQCLPGPRDWVEKEERRRTFWSTFCIDRYSSLGTGWPMIIEERDIMTNLPVSDNHFEQGHEVTSISLKEALTTKGAEELSPYGGVCLMAAMFGRNLTHLHRPDEDDDDGNLNGEFWKRHRAMDNILLNIALSLPSHFRLPGAFALNNSNIVFTNMNIHTSTICLHQAAIFKAEKNRMHSSVTTESRVRCITAAAEIANIMRMVSHLDLSGMNPFIPFCIYVASRVFVQYLKSHPKDEQVKASLQFLLNVMGHMKKKMPLVESFLVQLEVDLSGSLDDPNNVRKFPYSQKKGADELPLELSDLDSPHRPPHQLNPGSVHPIKKHTCSCSGDDDLSGLFGPDRQQQPNGVFDPNTPDNNSSCQSPASMDLSVNMPTPPSQNQSSSNSNYSPQAQYQEYPGGGGGGFGMSDNSTAQKSMFNWDMLDFDGPEFDQAMANGGFMTGGGMHTINAEMSEFFTSGSG